MNNDHLTKIAEELSADGHFTDDHIGDAAALAAASLVDAWAEDKWVLSRPPDRKHDCVDVTYQLTRWILKGCPAPDRTVR